MSKVLKNIVIMNVMLVSALWAADRKPIRMLFYGNSFTGMHNIPLLVKQLSESGRPDVQIDRILSLHGGERLKGHWEIHGNQIYLKLPERSAVELQAELADFEKAYAELKNKRKGKEAEEAEEAE
ncbi:MAG: hypothetical protein ABR497_11505 [Kiritimatiellia bacterium]